jgi:hypothetical protein
MTIRYCATTGDNSTGDGTEANPWYDPFYALTNVSGTSDEIIVKSGTYTSTQVWNGGSIENRYLHSETFDPKDVVIDRDGTDTQRIEGLSNARIHGISLINAYVLNGTSISIFQNFDGQYIRRCIFNNCAGTDGSRGRGGFISEGTTRIDNCDFINCWSSNSSSTLGGLVSATNDDFVLDMVNCLFYWDGDDIPAGYFIAPYVVHLGDGGSNRTVNVRNCITTLNNGTLTDFSQINSGNGTVNVYNSIIHNSPYTAGANDSNVLETDPLLEDPQNGFFRPSANSPAFGLGSII